MAGLSPVVCGSRSVRLCWGSGGSGAGAAERQFLVLVPPARPVPPKMGLLRLLPILVPFILLGAIQEPGLVEGTFNSKYWRLSPPSGERELCREEGTRNATDEE